MSGDTPYSLARQRLVIRDATPAVLSEMEIQARLFAGELGTIWKTPLGDMEVLHFGDWNHEAGPDFKNVHFRMADGTECHGDLEVDNDARDWERHGHATNPNYAGVLLHLVVLQPATAAFARTVDHRSVLQGLLVVPEVRPATLAGGGCPVDKETAIAMISEAADHRLREKCARAARSAQLHGPSTALFHAIARGLGYKNNSLPFLLIAQRLGLRRDTSLQGAAIMFGLAGFLEPRSFDDADEVTRFYLKPLWDEWWKVRDKESRLGLPRSAWRMSGLRPANHPHRRLGALAALMVQFPKLQKAFEQGGQRGVEKFFEQLTDPFWSLHWNLASERLTKPAALVGPDRARDLLINAFFVTLPFEQAKQAMGQLPGPTPSSRVLRACEWLVGHVEPSLFRTARHQQGLLQLVEDFGAMSAAEAQKRIQEA